MHAAGTDSTFEVGRGELAGFGLAGWRQLNGTIQLISSKRYIGDWPEEINFFGNTYTLEEVIKGSIDQKSGAIFENAEYA